MSVKAAKSTPPTTKPIVEKTPRNRAEYDDWEQKDAYKRSLRADKNFTPKMIKTGDDELDNVTPRCWMLYHQARKELGLPPRTDLPTFPKPQKPSWWETDER